MGRQEEENGKRYKESERQRETGHRDKKKRWRETQRQKRQRNGERHKRQSPKGRQKIKIRRQTGHRGGSYPGKPPGVQP